MLFKKHQQKLKFASIAMALCMLAGGNSFAGTKANLNTWEQALLHKNPGYTLEQKATADVTGDGKLDTVYVLAHKFDKTSLYRDHYRLAVLNGDTHQWTQTALPNNCDGGYQATLTLADLQGSSAKEILWVASTGGSGGYVNFVAYRYENQQLKVLLDSDQGGKTTEITGAFQDDYKVHLTLKALNKAFDLNVKDRKPFYEDGHFYKAGKLVVPAKPDSIPTPWGGGSDQITLKKNAQTGRNDLIWHTVAKGIANADSLAEITVTWTAQDHTLIPTDVQLKQIYALDTPLLTQPLSNVQTVAVEESGAKGTNTMLPLKASATQTLLKHLYATAAQPTFYPTELQRQESDPKFTLSVTYKDGKSELLKTTETGEFVYRMLDKEGSWSGAKFISLPAEVERAKNMSASVTLGKNKVGMNAEAQANPQLEKAIVAKLGIPKEEFSKTRYYYNYVDLNNDGHNEVFAVVVGPYTSGTGGSTALIATPTEKSGYKVNQVFTLIQTPLIISDKMTSGHHDIVTLRSGGGAKSTYVTLTYQNGRYTTVNQGRPVKDVNAVSGTVIIANDMAKDLEKGTALFLTGK